MVLVLTNDQKCPVHAMVLKTGVTVVRRLHLLIRGFVLPDNLP